MAAHLRAQDGEIQINPVRSTDQAAFISAAPRGTGASLRLRVIGQRGAERLTEFEMSAYAWNALVAQRTGA